MPEMMNNIQPIVTAIEEVRRTLLEHTDLEVFSRVPRDRPDRFFIIDSGVPQNTVTVHDRTPVFIKSYSMDLDETLEMVNLSRRALWGAQGGTILGYREEFGPHETFDPDLPEWHIWQTGGQLFQYVP